MLHGYTQSGPLFRSKTRALEKNLAKAFPTVSLYYPTAPLRLLKADVPKWDDTGGSVARDEAEEEEAEEDTDAWGWWKRRGEKEPFVYEGIEEGFARVAEVLRADGPFDGVIGFSQGGALAGMLASLLEPGRREALERRYSEGGMRFPESFLRDTAGGKETVHAPLRFAVSYSGFGASANELYAAFYEPKIATPMLHFIGSVDTVVEEARSLRLVDACVDGRREGRVVYHPGGHFLPSSQRQYVGALIAFIRDALEGPEKDSEARAEDMDVPF